MKKLINEQFLRMRLLAGLITESQYEAEKKMLSENPVRMSMQEFMPKIDEITKKMNIHLMPQVLGYNDFISKMNSIKGDFSKAGVTGDKTVVIAATGLNGQADSLCCFSLSDDPTNPKASFKLIDNFYEVVKKEFPTTTFKQFNSTPYDVTGEFAKLHGEKVVVGMAVITNFVKPAAAATPTSESTDIEKSVNEALKKYRKLITEDYYDEIKDHVSKKEAGKGNVDHTGNKSKFQENDEVKSKSTKETGKVYDVLITPDKKGTVVVVKWEKDGMKSIGKYGPGFSSIEDIEK